MSSPINVNAVQKVPITEQKARKNNAENLVIREKDLKKCPTPKPLVKGAHYSIGDLHGNAINFISFLVEEGFLNLTSNFRKNLTISSDLAIIFAEDIKKLTEEQKNTFLRDLLSDEKTLREKLYDKLVKIYEQNLTKENKPIFDLIVKNAKINEGASIALIGDEVGDRGNNDYFTFKVLDKLQPEDPKEPSVPVEILVSDHGAEFLKLRANNYDPNYGNRFGAMDNDLRRSSVKLAEALNAGILGEPVEKAKQEFDKMVERCYIRNLKIRAGNSDPEHVEYSGHSLAGLDEPTLRALADKLGVKYLDSTPTEEDQTLDKINQKLQESLHTQKDAYKGKTDLFTIMYLTERYELYVIEQNALKALEAGKPNAQDEKAMAEYEKEKMKIKSECDVTKASEKHPIVRMIWGRLDYSNQAKDIGKLAREKLYRNKDGSPSIDPKTGKQYRRTLSYKHGHDAEGVVRSDHLDYVSNLDHVVGKGRPSDKTRNIEASSGIESTGHYVINISTRGEKRRFALSEIEEDILPPPPLTDKEEEVLKKSDDETPPPPPPEFPYDNDLLKKIIEPWENVILLQMAYRSVINEDFKFLVRYFHKIKNNKELSDTEKNDFVERLQRQSQETKNRNLLNFSKENLVKSASESIEKIKGLFGISVLSANAGIKQSELPKIATENTSPSPRTNVGSTTAAPLSTKPAPPPKPFVPAGLFQPVSAASMVKPQVTILPPKPPVPKRPASKASAGMPENLLRIEAQTKLEIGWFKTIVEEDIAKHRGNGNLDWQVKKPEKTPDGHRIEVLEKDGKKLMDIEKNGPKVIYKLTKVNRDTLSITLRNAGKTPIIDCRDPNTIILLAKTEQDLKKQKVDIKLGFSKETQNLISTDPFLKDNPDLKRFISESTKGTQAKKQ